MVFKSNSHLLATINLERQGMETFLPMHKIITHKQSNFTYKVVPLFPNYMFVAIDTNNQTWHKISGTTGVSRIIINGIKPEEVSEEVISELKSRCNDNGIFSCEKKIHKGDQVKLLNNAFSKYLAIVDKVDADQRIWVLLDLLGRKTRLHVHKKQLGPVNC